MSSDLKSNIHQIDLTMVERTGSAIYRFEDLTLDAEHLMLYRNSEELSLTPKQVETLLALVEKRGEIVSKDVLMTRLWGDSAVEESNLIQNIYVLRKTLGETANGKPLIETLRRRGYRFNGELEKSGTADPAHQPTTVAAAPQTQGTRSIWGPRGAIGIAFLVLLLVMAGYLLYPRKPSAAPAKVALAVLPLKPIDSVTRDNLYEIGIADALINRLASAQGFEIRSLNAVRDYNDIAQDPLVAGREQQVDFVLAANYQIADGKIRITAPLFNVATGTVEESYTIEKETSNHFAVQDAIASDFGARLLRRFSGTDAGPAVKRGTESEQAYQLYLQGTYLCDKSRNAEATKKAIEYLEQATTLDPGYAQAWAAKALAHRYASYASDDNRAHYQRSMEAISKALAMDPNLPEAYAALCDNKFIFEYDYAGAEAACKRAVELGPNSAIAHQIYSHFLTDSGRPELSAAEIRTAMDLAPTSYFNKRYYANGLYFWRQYDQAVAEYKQLVDLNPTNRGTYNWLIKVLDAQGSDAEAFDWLLRSLTLQESGDETITRFRNVYRSSGWRGVLLEQIKIGEAATPRNNWQLANLYARVGDKDKAFECLEKMYQERSYFMTLVKRDPQFDSLRDDPRYADLVQRIGGS